METQRGQHCRAREVLTGDQLKTTAQAVELREQDTRDLRVLAAQLTEVGAVEGLVHGHGSLRENVTVTVGGLAQSL